MNKKILILLVVFFVAISIACVYAEEMESHDFGKFKMDIPVAPNGEIEETQGGTGNHPIYAIPNPDSTLFAYADYFDTSYVNGTKNVTDFVLNKVKENYTVDVVNGTPTWVFDGDENSYASNMGYLVSSDDDTKVVIIQGKDTYIQDAVNSIEFK